MSFSGDVKTELSTQTAMARHCQLAELAAIISHCGTVCVTAQDKIWLKVQTENITVVRKCFTLLEKAFNIYKDVAVRRNCANQKSRIYLVTVPRHEDAVMVLQALKMLDTEDNPLAITGMADGRLIQNSCCKRAFLRGAFLACGSISDPKNFYHLELVVNSFEKAEQIQEVIQTFQLTAHIVVRKRYYVVYLKEGSQIVDMLNVMEAHQSLMALENIRILKEIANSVNRKVNCETANIHKSVSAARGQIEDILLIQNTIGLEQLPIELKTIALARLEHPSTALKELGELIVPTVGKSGVNHRFRKIKTIADRIRENKEDGHEFKDNYN